MPWVLCGAPTAPLRRDCGVMPAVDVNEGEVDPPAVKSIAARISEGFLSNAFEIDSRLSMLGRFVPRSMALICETLSRVCAARSLRDQSRSTRSILMR